MRPDSTFFLIKSAHRDLIKYCGGVERAALVASMSRSQMGRFNDANSPDIMGLQVVLALEADCGMAPVTRAMAEANGRALAAAAASDGGPCKSVCTAYVDFAGDAATMLADGAEAIADGSITPLEAARLQKNLGALDAALTSFRRALSDVRGEARA